MQRGPRINYFLRLGLDGFLLTLFLWVASHQFRNDQTLCLTGNCGWLLAFNLLIWYIAARVFHFYTSITLFSFSQELTLLLRVIALHLLVFVFFLALLFPSFYSLRGQILQYYLLILIAFPFIKYFYRVAVAFIRSHYQYVRKILIVGDLGPGTNLFRSGMLINNLR